ncbi:unnamed protein product [Rhodiola kirilowii]
MKELNQFKRSVKMLNSGSKNVNEILRSQRMESRHRGLGFLEEGSSRGTTLVKAKPVAEQHPGQKVNQNQGKPPASQRKTRNALIRPYSEQKRDSHTC